MRGVDRLLGEPVAQHELRIAGRHRRGDLGHRPRAAAHQTPPALQPLGPGRGVFGGDGAVERRSHRWRQFGRCCVREQQRRQRAEEQRHVDPGRRQPGKQLLQQLAGAGVGIEAKPCLATEVFTGGGRIDLLVLAQHVLDHTLVVVEQRQQRLTEPGHVPQPDAGLVAERVAPLAGVGGVGGPAEIEVVDPAVRPVVDGEPEQRHVVGVHDAVHEADRLPVRDQARGASRDFVQQRFVGLAPGCTELREVQPDREGEQLSQQRQVAARRRQLEVAEAQERRRHAAHDRTRFVLRIAVVEHVAHDPVAGADQRQRAGGRHAERPHRLAAQELADRRAQYGTTVAAP